MSSPTFIGRVVIILCVYDKLLSNRPQKQEKTLGIQFFPLP